MKFGTAIGRLALASAFSFPAAHAQARPGTITTFGVPGAHSTSPVSINKVQSITGQYLNDGEASCIAHGFVRAADGTFTNFDPQGAQGHLIYTQPAAINDFGAVAGLYYEAESNCFNAVTHGFVRAADGTTTSFDVPYLGMVTAGMNNAGTVVGYGVDYDFTRFKFVNHGFLRTSDGQLTIADVPGSDDTRPTAINHYGVITGSFLDAQNKPHGFVRDPQGNVTAFDVAGASETRPLGINNAGTTTGYYLASQDEHGFIRAADGTITVFDAPNSLLTEPRAIDRHGTITGRYADDQTHTTRGFLRLAKGKVFTFDAPGGTQTAGLATNRQGTAAAGTYRDANNVTQGYIDVR